MTIVAKNLFWLVKIIKVTTPTRPEFLGKTQTLRAADSLPPPLSPHYALTDSHCVTLARTLYVDQTAGLELAEIQLLLLGHSYFSIDVVNRDHGNL